MQRLVPLLSSRSGPSIVYVTLQKQAEDIAKELSAKGIEAKSYHAGMKSEDRERIQNDFMTSVKGVVVATIAFGMGIDKGSL